MALLPDFLKYEQSQLKSRLDNYNKIRKNKLNKALYNKNVNNKEVNTNNNLAENLDTNGLIISNLNIKEELKNENYINSLLNDDNVDNIMEFVNINLNYAKIAKNIDISYLCNEQFFNLHLYFLDYISDLSVTKIILEFIKEIALNDKNKLICKIFEYNEKAFFNKLIEMINDNQNNSEICEIILQLFIYYINIFNNFNKIKSKKSIEIEMKDNTIYYNNQIIENIYNISIILLLNKHFDKSLYLISNIIKIIYKSNNIEIFDNIITNKNNVLMLEFILQKDYSDCQNNIIYTADIFKYIIKFGWNNNNKVKEIIQEVDNYFNKNNNILKTFIHLLLNKNLKLKEKTILKLIAAI